MYVLLTTCLFAGLMFWPRVGRTGKLLLVGYVILMAVGLFCTYTRSAWLGAIVALALLTWFVLPWRMRAPVFIGGLMLVVAVVAAYGNRFFAFKRDTYATAADTGGNHTSSIIPGQKLSGAQVPPTLFAVGPNGEDNGLVRYGYSRMSSTYSIPAAFSPSTPMVKVVTLCSPSSELRSMFHCCHCSWVISPS